MGWLSVAGRLRPRRIGFETRLDSGSARALNVRNLRACFYPRLLREASVDGRHLEHSLEAAGQLSSIQGLIAS